jgi:peptidoglycan L-alanyl-D-glutamate endopeptidase CwlK
MSGPRYIGACRFGTISAFNVSTCHPDLQLVLNEAIRRAPAWLDFAVTCGHRSKADQDEAYRKGTSKKRWPNSLHNTDPARAADIRPASPFTAEDWKDRLRFARIIGFIEGVALDLNIPIRLGMDFSGDGRSLDESFVDLPHIELA